MNCPDLRPHFAHLQERVMPHSMGIPVLSDWADKADDDPVFGIYKQCGFLNRDEARILYECSLQLLGGRWLDIGSHTGWGARHIDAGNAVSVTALDPMYANPEFAARAMINCDSHQADLTLAPTTSRMWFGGDPRYPKPMMPFGAKYSGVIIDGDHSWEHPLYDAVQSFKHLEDRGVILLHDFIGGPVREAVKYLKCEGMKCRIYFASAQLLAVCWRGDFTPPDVPPNPLIDVENLKRQLAAPAGDFYFENCE